MNSKFKHSLLAIALTGFISSSAFAATSISSPTLGESKIQGYRPYMEAIGTRIVAGGQQDPQDATKIIPTVGAIIEVPSYLTGSELFKFVDKDGDLVAQLGKQFNTPNGLVTGQTEFEIKWFKIKAKENYKFADDTSASGTDVSSWDHVDAVEIPSAFVGNNKNSRSLVVPEDASGYRIGFIAVPTSEYGYPNQGSPIRAWDISKIWKQNAPEKPGECFEGSTDPACNDNGGEPGTDNPGGGGGEVIATDWVMNIYDGVTNQVLKAGDPLLVDSEYYATIRIKQADNTYREPTVAELATLKWNIINTTDKSVVASYTYAEDASRVYTRDGTVLDGYKAYAFKTQLVNTDAKDPLQKTLPNYSEQGWGLSVTLDIEQ